MASMGKIARLNLEQLGRVAAQQVAGADAVENVEVSSGEDWSGRPIYQFAFLIDQARARQRAGVIRIRLIQALLDALIARGDEHLPSVQILSRADWDRRNGARPH